MIQTFGTDTPDLELIRVAMVTDDVAGMSIGPHEARLLQFLIRAFGVRSILEIGTLLGYSAAAMAAALPADGQLITIESDATRHQRAREHLKFESRVELRRGAALDVLSATTETFDMVFIDANKREYPRYLDWAERHVRTRGLIVGDNTFLWGAVYGDDSREPPSSRRAEAMREFNRRLSDPRRYNSILIPTVEGMTVAQKLF